MIAGLVLVPVTVTVNVVAVVPVHDKVDVVEPPDGGVTLACASVHDKPVDGDTVGVNDTALLNPF